MHGSTKLKFSWGTVSFSGRTLLHGVNFLECIFIPYMRSHIPQSSISSKCGVTSMMSTTRVHIGSVVRRSCCMTSAVSCPAINICHSCTIIEDTHKVTQPPVAYPRILFLGWVQQIQLRTEDRENGDLWAVASQSGGCAGSCNLVQEISFHIIKFS